MASLSAGLKLTLPLLLILLEHKKARVLYKHLLYLLYYIIENFYRIFMWMK